MFRNLKAEMMRQNITLKDLAKAIHRSEESVRLKINEKIGIRYSECVKIANLFKENNSLDYLFKSYKD